MVDELFGACFHPMGSAMGTGDPLRLKEIMKLFIDSNLQTINKEGLKRILNIHFVHAGKMTEGFYAIF